MNSWWQLGEGIGQLGDKLAMHNITCPFCLERGNFKTTFHAEKKKPNARKLLNFDTLECANCKGYVMVLWSAAEFCGREGIHAYRVLPWPLNIDKSPEHWPKAIGRFWIQAHRNLSGENWDAAAVMARSALQAALREHQASGSNLKEEINDLAKKGVLPPLMRDWSNNVRELGNDSAHPSPEDSPTSPDDALDVVSFLDFLLEYLYDLPHRIEAYRKRKAS